MYKILPILLFVLCFPNQISRVDGYAQMDIFISEVEKGLFDIVDENKVNISYDMNKMQMLGLDSIYMYNDSMFTKEINEIKSSFPDQNNLVGFALHIAGDDSIQIWIGEINISIDVDKTIELTNNFKKGIQSLIYGLDAGILWLEECDSCISFTNIDMDSLKEANNTMSLHRDDIYNDSWAVIIGIDKYDNLSNLDYAVADAQAVKNMLINKFDYKEENVKLLINEEANKTNIINVISDVSLKAGEDDRILVFYAGHGETMPLPDGGEMGYLVPIDGNQDNLLASAIPMDDVKRFSNVSKAKHMLFLVDACYGGLAAVGSRGLEPAKTPNYIEKITSIKSRQIITAGGKEEKVFEKSEWGHSAYTKNLLNALEEGYADSNGDGYITADELGDYLGEKVSIDSDNQQTPQSRRLTSHEGEFVFVYNDKISSNKPKSNHSDTDKKLDMLLTKFEKLESKYKNSNNTNRLPNKHDKVLLNNETYDKGINVFGLGLFSGSNKKIINEKVKGGLLVSIFGNAKLNLVDAKLNQDKNIINIIVLFGGCTILVPPEMYVDTQILPIFGSFKNRNDYIVEDSNRTNKKLIVRGVAIFGGGSVRNEKWYDTMGNWQ